MKKIITFTPNPALDVSTATDKLVPEDKLRCDKPQREPGGGGVNVARALKRLEHDATAVYTCGGAIGDLYKKLLQDEGVDQHPMKIESTMRQSVMVKEKEKDDLYRLVMPGGELKEEEWQKMIDLVDDFPDSEYLVASGSLPPGAPDNFYAHLSKKAKENDIRFILDTSGDALEKVKESGAFLLKPNEKELSELVGRELEYEEDIKEAAKELLEKYDVEVLVVSLGGEGAMLATKDSIEKLPAPQVEKRSTVGAGDSMVAGIVAKLSEGKEVREAVLYGLACGSAAIMTPGSELLHKKDADELFEKSKNRA